VNGRGATLADRLQDIPNRAREIAGHGARQGAATALATVQTQLGHKLWNLQPVFPEGEDRVDFEELIDELDKAVGAISAEVDVEGIVNRIFLDE
jgi:hypothetical protein